MEFVRAMALSWKNLSAYPPGHPILVRTLEDVERALAVLRGPAGEVILGISTDGLIYGSTKVDALAAQKFAHALFTRGVALLRFGSDTTPRDIEVFLRLLAAGTGGGKRALWDDLTAAGIVSINLQPVNYSTIQVTDTLGERESREEQPHSLWDDIVRALLENKQFATGGASRATIADELTRMISQYVDDGPTFDPGATFGVRVPTRANDQAVHAFLDYAIGEHIRQSSGAKKQHSLEQAVQLIRELPEPLRGTVLRAVAKALASDDTAEPLLRQFASELPADEVLDALRYLAATGELSSHATALVQALTTVEAPHQVEADADNVTSSLISLFADEDVHRFTPREYQELLGNVTVHIPHVPPEAVVSLEQIGVRSENAADVIPQLANVLVDLLRELGPARPADAILRRLEAVFGQHVSAGDFNEAVALVERMQNIAKRAPSDQLQRAIAESLKRLATGDALNALVESVHQTRGEAAPHIQRLTDALGHTALRSLLVALADEKNRSRRRRLFDFIASLGPVIVKEAMPFLADERWYVVRNIIVLLRTVHDRSSLPEIEKLAWHEDLRVRMESIRSLHVLKASVPVTLLDEIFSNPDPKVAEAAIAFVGTHGIAASVESLLRIVEGNDLLGARRILRVKALRALGEIGEPRALPQIERFLTSTVLPWPPRDERYVAWESLKGYPSAAIEGFLQRGLKSWDPQIRAICARLGKV